jgi:hypothetical protein
MLELETIAGGVVVVAEANVQSSPQSAMAATVQQRRFRPLRAFSMMSRSAALSRHETSYRWLTKTIGAAIAPIQKTATMEQ